MAIITTCRVCGREFEPERAAIRAGTWRDGCPRCRQAGGPTQAAATSRPPLVPVRPRAVDGPEAA